MFEYLAYVISTILALIPGQVQEQPQLVAPIETATENTAPLEVTDEISQLATNQTATDVEKTRAAGIQTKENPVADTLTATNLTPKNMWKDYQKPSEDVLREQLSELAFRVTQKDGTERSRTSPLDLNDAPGIYVDILSGEPLFSSKDKFDSGTGWPSFTQPIIAGAVTEHRDFKLILPRTEIRSAIADNHLGHVFTDGPKDSTGLRYCMNGVALRFVPQAEMEAAGYADFIKYL